MEKAREHVPSMSDAAVTAKTGRAWQTWFGLLDAAGAERLAHRAIVGILSDEHGVPSWWRQMIAVEYERARGLRARHETASGFSVSISKTIAINLTALYAASADPAMRRKWLPPGQLEVSSATPDKYIRGAWNGTGRLAMNFAAKGVGKSQIAVEVGKLADAAGVAREKAAWQRSLATLQALLTA